MKIIVVFEDLNKTKSYIKVDNDSKSNYGFDRV